MFLPSFLKRYKNSEERQAAMEQLLLEVQQLKTPEGKLFCIPQMLEIGNIYMQAENELYEAMH